MVNINNFEFNEEIPNNIWEEIFNKQKDLLNKYKDIEKMGDLLETLDNNIHTKKGQKWIKDFAWRLTEELAEANEAKNKSKEHYKEELIDALHFFVELALIANYDYDFFELKNINDNISFWDIVYNLGLMCNTLKNKSWKQTQILTDKNEFEKYLQKTFLYLRNLLFKELGNDEMIYIYYFKKNKVNKFRQKSNY